MGNGRERVFVVVALLLLLPACLGTPRAKVSEPTETPGIRPPRPPGEWQSNLTKVRFSAVVHSVHSVASKDGQTQLAVDLYQPDAFGAEKLPTILILSPYWAVGYPKELRGRTPLLSPSWLIDHFVPRGYTLALADMRGTRNSGGCFDFGGNGDQEDGYALVEWLGTRPWSNGKVGMYGVSHVGMSQVAAAVANPPHLTTIVPIAAIHSFYRYLYMGGVHYDLNMFTPPAYTGVATLPPTDPTSPHFLRNLADTGCKALEYNLEGVSQDGRFDAFWKERDYPLKAPHVNASIFFVHGFADSNVKFDHVDAMWRAMAQRSQGPFVKAFFGNWGHEEPPVDIWRKLVHRWFDHWLLGVDTGFLQEPQVTIQRDDDAWRNETAWPAPSGANQTFYLAPGVLEAGQPTSAWASWQDVPETLRGYEPPGSFLRHESQPLEADLHVSGTPVVTLEVASDKASTHFVVLVQVVSSSGASTLWNRGYLDSRQRLGVERDDVLLPGQRIVVNVSLFPTDSLLPKGARLRVLVESSDACHYVVGPVAARCGPTGVVSDTTLASNTLYYGGKDPSRLFLPLDDGRGVV